MTPDPNPARYCDYYSMLSYSDFLAYEAAGTLDAAHAISAGTIPGEAA